MFLHPFNRWGNTSGDQDPHLGHLTPKPPAEPPGSAASQGNVTLWKVTGTQAKSENKKNLQAMAVLKLLGRRVLSDSEITLCGYLSEKSKWKFPGLWPTVSFRSKSLWAWGVRGAQNFKLFSPGGRVTRCHAFTISCVPTILLVIMTTSLKECMSVPVSDGSERGSNVINVINKLEFEARFAWY